MDSELNFYPFGQDLILAFFAPKGNCGWETSRRVIYLPC